MFTVSEFMRRKAWRPLLQWACAQEDQSSEALWSTCPNGVWMVWYLAQLAIGTEAGSPEHRRAALVVASCAESALHRLSEKHRAVFEEMLRKVKSWAAEGGPYDVYQVLSISLDARRKITMSCEKHGRSVLNSGLESEVSSAIVYATCYPSASYAHADAESAAMYAVGKDREQGERRLADLIRQAMPLPPR